MDILHGSDERAAPPATGGSLPTIATHSPALLLSLSTPTAVLEATDPTGSPADGSRISSGSSSSNDSNYVDTSTTASVATESHTSSGSVVNDFCPIRASGQVCICDLCETTRLRLVRQCQSMSNRTATGTGTGTSSHSQGVDPSIYPARNKRSRDEAKYGSDDEEEDDDRVDHGDSVIPVHTDTSSTMALAEVVTTTTTNSTTSHPDRDDAEQHTLQIMSQACRTILQCIGEDPDREGLQKTPERWAKALLFLCHGYHLSPSQVTNNAVFSENHNEMVVVRNIDVHSLCEHHMVPFTGHVHIGYIPNGKIIGLSKLARLADLFARRLQVQERLTRQIADAILESIAPLGVAVVMECTHYCMVMRGVQKTGTITTTSSVRGCFETNSKTRAEFFSILHGGHK